MTFVAWLNYNSQLTRYDQARNLGNNSPPDLINLLKPVLNSWFSNPEGVLLLGAVLLVVSLALGYIEMIFTDHNKQTGIQRKSKDALGMEPTGWYRAWIIVNLAVGYCAIQYLLFIHANAAGVGVQEFSRSIILPTAGIMVVLLVIGAALQTKYGTLRQPEQWQPKPIPKTVGSRQNDVKQQ